MNKPWLKIIGISEHAPFDMSKASISLVKAEFVFGGKRHLKLLEWVKRAENGQYLSIDHF